MATQDEDSRGAHRRVSRAIAYRFPQRRGRIARSRLARCGHSFRGRGAGVASRSAILPTRNRLLFPTPERRTIRSSSRTPRFLFRDDGKEGKRVTTYRTRVEIPARPGGFRPYTMIVVSAIQTRASIGRVQSPLRIVKRPVVRPTRTFALVSHTPRAPRAARTATKASPPSASDGPQSADSDPPAPKRVNRATPLENLSDRPPWRSVARECRGRALRHLAHEQRPHVRAFLAEHVRRLDAVIRAGRAA